MNFTKIDDLKFDTSLGGAYKRFLVERIIDQPLGPIGRLIAAGRWFESPNFDPRICDGNFPGPHGLARGADISYLSHIKIPYEMNDAEVDVLVESGGYCHGGVEDVLTYSPLILNSSEKVRMIGKRDTYKDGRGYQLAIMVGNVEHRREAGLVRVNSIEGYKAGTCFVLWKM